MYDFPTLGQTMIGMIIYGNKGRDLEKEGPLQYPVEYLAAKLRCSISHVRKTLEWGTAHGHGQAGTVLGPL